MNAHKANCKGVGTFLSEDSAKQWETEGTNYSIEPCMGICTKPPSI